MAELDRVWEREQTLEQRVVLGFSFAVNFVRGHALFDRLLRSEPELLLPLLTVDGTAALALYRELIGQRLRTEVRAGRAAPVDVDQAAEVLARLAISLLLTVRERLRSTTTRRSSRSCAMCCCRCSRLATGNPTQRSTVNPSANAYTGSNPVPATL